MTPSRDTSAALRTLAWAALRAALGEIRVRPGSLSLVVGALVAAHLVPEAYRHQVEAGALALLGLLPAVVTTEPVPSDAIPMKRRPKGSPVIPAKPRKRKPRAKKAPAVLPPDAA